ncbi:MAG: class I SAM-dependent methyltransferase [Rhizomicrobium sp.]
MPEPSIPAVRIADPPRSRMPTRKRAPVPRIAAILCRFALDPEYRSAALLRIRRPPNLFQPSNHTFSVRYPDLFQFAREYLGDGPERRLLSFGCSTGEEVFALRRYFPKAAITGIDINPRNIAACRSRLVRSPDSGIAFDAAGSTVKQPTAFYDAIFCLSVLRHSGLRAADTGRCDHLIRFADFERTVEDFARCLKPGGLLVVANSNFRFCDTGISSDFTAVLREDHYGPDARTPVFGRDDVLIPERFYDEIGFRKAAAASASPR